MPTDNKSNENSSRWWEFYAVRYAMGTVIGAVVFYFLCLSTPFLRPLLFNTAAEFTAGAVPSSTPTVKLEVVQLSLLATYGLVYCYISSAPILVLHAGRFLLRLRIVGSAWTKLWFLLLLLLPPLIGSITFSRFASTLGFGERWFYSISSFIAILIVWFQYLVAGLTLLKSGELFKFYSSLALKREKAKGGITDSYRHLREHGNSFFIVFLEVMLGVILVGASSVVGQSTAPAEPFPHNLVLTYLIILVIWIIPAVCVWLIGTLFELEFCGIEADHHSPPAEASCSKSPQT